MVVASTPATVLDDGEWVGLLPLKSQRVEHYSVLSAIARGFYEQVIPSPAKKSIKASPKTKGERKTVNSARKAGHDKPADGRKKRTPAVQHSPPTKSGKISAGLAEESEATSPLSSGKPVTVVVPVEEAPVIPLPQLLPSLQTSFISEGENVTVCCLNPGEFFYTNLTNESSTAKAQICLWNSDSSSCIWRFFLEPHTAVTHLVVLERVEGKRQIVVIACRLLPDSDHSIDTKSNALLWLVDAATGVVLINSLRLSGGPVGKIILPTKRFSLTPDDVVTSLLGAVTLQGKLHIINSSRLPICLPSCYAPALQQVIDLKEELLVNAPDAKLNHIRLFVVEDQLRCVITFSDGKIFCLHDGLWRSIDCFKYLLRSDFYEVPYCTSEQDAKLNLLLAESASLNRVYRCAENDGKDVLSEILMCEDNIPDGTLEHCMDMVFAAAYIVSPTECLGWLENLITRLIEVQHFDLLKEIIEGFISAKKTDGLFPWNSENLSKPLVRELSSGAIRDKIVGILNRSTINDPKIDELKNLLCNTAMKDVNEEILRIL